LGVHLKKGEKKKKKRKKEERRKKKKKIEEDKCPTQKERKRFRSPSFSSNSSSFLREVYEKISRRS
jgi:hypothetical protein